MSSISAPQSPLHHPPQHVTSKELGTVQKYTTNGAKAQMGRTYEYISQNKMVVLKFVGGVAETAVLGAVVGAALGGAAGALVAGPPGATDGVFRGMAVGAAIGAALSIRRETVKVQLSNHYNDWKKTAINDKVLPIYRRFITEENLATCPLSLDLVVVPYRCKHGYIFERDDLEKVFTVGKKERVICPIGRNPERPTPADYDSWSECSYDTDYHLNLFAQLKDRSLENPDVRRIVKEYQDNVRSNEIKISSARIEQELTAVASGGSKSDAMNRIGVHIDRLALFKTA